MHPGNGFHAYSYVTRLLSARPSSTNAMFSAASRIRVKTASLTGLHSNGRASLYICLRIYLFLTVQRHAILYSPSRSPIPNTALSYIKTNTTDANTNPYPVLIVVNIITSHSLLLELYRNSHTNTNIDRKRHISHLLVHRHLQNTKLFPCFSLSCIEYYQQGIRPLIPCPYRHKVNEIKRPPSSIYYILPFLSPNTANTSLVYIRLWTESDKNFSSKCFTWT